MKMQRIDCSRYCRKGKKVWPATWFSWRALFLLFLTGWAVPACQPPIQSWVATFDGLAHRNDKPADMKVDEAGNVYVTGATCSEPCSASCAKYDYGTVKYGPNGQTIWTAIHDGTDNGMNLSRSLALDASGNVYVTGSSCNQMDLFWEVCTDPDSHYLTIKYDPEGNELWVASYDGPGLGMDEATALAVDGLGNVTVTGSSEGAGTQRDIATVKYGPDGGELWVARYNGAGNGDDRAYSLALDSSGNIHVTGASVHSGVFHDFVTVKYDPNGGEIWTAFYDGPGHFDDFARYIALDADGNVLLTGSSQGNGTGSDYATIKYDPEGNELWVARYDGNWEGPGEGSDDYPRALAVDGSGNVFVTGVEGEGIEPFLYRNDYATVKYDSEGNELWIARFSGDNYNWDQPSDIALDTSGNVYVTGTSSWPLTNSGYVTLKYNPAGQQIWMVRYGGTGDEGHLAVAMDVDGAGNVYVTGWGGEVGYDDNYVTVKYRQE